MHESIKTTYVQEDIAWYCLYEFLMRQKAGQGAIKQCNALFSISVDNGTAIPNLELGVVEVLPTFQPEIPN